MAIYYYKFYCEVAGVKGFNNRNSIQYHIGNG